MRWIELLSHLDPDGGSGLVEFVLTAFAAAMTCVLAAFLRARLKRRWWGAGTSRPVSGSRGRVVQAAVANPEID